jgi:hypothetical protein
MTDRPILKPLIALLHSRRFMLLLLTLIAFFLIPQIPNLSDVWKNRLADIVFYGGAALFVALTGEDLLTTWQKPAKPENLDSVLQEMLKEALAALNPPRSPELPLVGAVKYPVASTNSTLTDKDVKSVG